MAWIYIFTNKITNYHLNSLFSSTNLPPPQFSTGQAFTRTTAIMVGFGHHWQECLLETCRALHMEILSQATALWNTYLSVPMVRRLQSLSDSGVPIQAATPVAAQGGSTVSGSKCSHKRRRWVQPGPRSYGRYCDRGERLLGSVDQRICYLKYVTVCFFCNGKICHFKQENVK